MATVEPSILEELEYPKQIKNCIWILAVPNRWSMIAGVGRNFFVASPFNLPWQYREYAYVGSCHPLLMAQT
jgi:hypothetical protein